MSQTETREELLPVVQGALDAVREVAGLCEEAGIESTVGTEECKCGKQGCAPKFRLLVPKDELAKVQQLLQDRMQEALARDGLTPIAVEDSGEGDPPCPACGTAAPLVDGACSDCGLQLE